jgi:hypothetical protein
MDREQKLIQVIILYRSLIRMKSLNGVSDEIIKGTEMGIQILESELGL